MVIRLDKISRMIPGTLKDIPMSPGVPENPTLSIFEDLLETDLMARQTGHVGMLLFLSLEGPMGHSIFRYLDTSLPLKNINYSCR